MDKLNMTSMNNVQENIKKIQQFFPNAVTEVLRDGKPTLAIDFDILKQEMSGTLIDDKEERYQFTWPDKKKSILLANSPISATLRPCKEESVDFDNTQNLYIEGDNLDVLKLLQETYLGKIKMIYIDPPYNTGNDFVYNDDFAENAEDYLANSGQYDNQGNRLVQNNESHGRFHTDWLNMIFPRLKIAKDLLSEDGVIFISIGQDENHNMIKMCDEIYSENNRVGVISRMMKSGGNKGQFFSPNIEYILVYAKSISQLGFFREPLSEELIEKVYNQIETDGPKKGQKYRIMGLYQAGLEVRPNQRYWIQCPDGSFAIPQGTTFPEKKETGAKVLPQDGDGVWRWSNERLIAELKNGNILFKRTNTSSLVNEMGEKSKWNIYTKIWLDERLEEGRVPVDLITKWENRISSQELKDLGIPFDFAKPVELLKYLISLIDGNKKMTILDFFSGSATTAHAVMQLNAEDGGKRKFIMVQLPEKCDEKSEAFKAGYKNICEIGKERIRRAGTHIVEAQASLINAAKSGAFEQGSVFAEWTSSESALKTQAAVRKQLDVGFRVLKLDSSNMKDVYYKSNAYTQDLLSMLEDNIKEDRSPLDLLFQVMLELGKPLSAKIEEKEIAGKHVFIVDENDLIACFDKNVTEEVVKAITLLKPLYAVFRDSSLENDSANANLDQIFATYSPNTTRKVL